jgi:homoserine trans-succinylase
MFKLADFTKEVLQAISQMKHNKAPGLDMFPAKFYRTFYEVIKKIFDGFICASTFTDV